MNKNSTMKKFLSTAKDFPSTKDLLATKNFPSTKDSSTSKCFPAAKVFFTALIFSALLITSCVTPKAGMQAEGTEQNEQQEAPLVLSRSLLGEGQLTPIQLARYFLSQNPDEDPNHILNFAIIYIQEAKAENINSDAAFAQMCLETGYLRFGGLVQKEWHNYCGLGAMSAENPGCIFETETLGVRAHIQHLQAYATTADVPLNNQQVDPRYSWVHKTKFVEDIFGLAGTWATDKEYGTKLDNILTRMEQINSK